MMKKLGFNNQWVATIMKCCSTVKYRYRFNGVVTEEIIPERGLRQGDPISPYLFLLCAEAFSSLLNSAEEDNSLEGIKNMSGCTEFQSPIVCR
jgi:hypothetical protein